MSPKLFFFVVALLPFIYTQTVPENNGSYNYDDPNGDWGNVNPRCNGNMQSGIALSRLSTATTPLKRLTFYNYDVPLATPLILQNNGHSASIDLPVTTNGNRAAITGGVLRDRYEAVNAHFHWGSENTKGSEHTIDGKRYDVELHIVHKNVKYATVDEAIQHKDGLAVLGIMLKRANNPDRFYPGLNKIYSKLPNIINYQDSSELSGTISVGQLLGDVNTKSFYTYSGSLTTPPCAEAVTWHVFPTPIPISAEQNSLFFNLLDNRGLPLLNNFRPLQRRNGRPILYRLPILF